VLVRYIGLPHPLGHRGHYLEIQKISIRSVVKLGYIRLDEVVREINSFWMADKQTGKNVMVCSQIAR
jgi:hypothetical protein